jgi:broad specificity phosphatase PhoE
MTQRHAPFAALGAPGTSGRGCTGKLGQLLLVRDGQASFNSDDYDVLSPLGWEQGRLLGEALSGRVVPTVLVTGGMRRHHETAEAVCDAAGWSAMELVEDHGWDEFDHLAMLDAHPSKFGDRLPSKAEFQGWLEGAAHRWTSGDFDGDYAEPWATFTARIDSALARTAELAGPTGTTVVFTSGGPVSWVVSTVLAGTVAPESRTPLWSRLNRVVVNSSVSKIAVGRDELSLVSFNEHSHLEGVGLS